MVWGWLQVLRFLGLGGCCGGVFGRLLGLFLGLVSPITLPTGLRLMAEAVA